MSSDFTEGTMQILGIMIGSSWFIRNENINKDLEVPLVKYEFEKVRIKYISKL